MIPLPMDKSKARREPLSAPCVSASTVLYWGVDSLVLNGFPEISYSLISKLRRLQVEAEKAHHGMPMHLGNRVFKVRSKGLRHFDFFLQHPDMHIYLWNKGNEITPSVQIDFSSAYLLEIGPEVAGKEAARIFRSLDRNRSCSRMTVSRLDMCADLLDFEFNESDCTEFSCKAGKERREFDRGVFTGVYKGMRKQAMFGRIYNKSREIVESSGKTYMRDIWGLDKDDQGEYPEVWRVEFQFNRAFFRDGKYFNNEKKQVSEPDFEAVMKSLAGIWDYSVKSWLVLRDPSSKNKQKCRRKVDPRWEPLQDLDWGELSGYEFVRGVERKAKNEDLIAQMRGCAISYACNDRNTDLEAVLIDICAQILKPEAFKKKSLTQRFIEKGFPIEELLKQLGVGDKNMTPKRIIENSCMSVSMHRYERLYKPIKSQKIIKMGLGVKT